MTGLLIRLFVRNKDDVSDPRVRTAYGNLAGAVGIVCNLLLCCAKLLAGLVAGSVSVMADGLNNLSDASSSIVTLLGFRLSAKPADKEHQMCIRDRLISTCFLGGVQLFFIGLLGEYIMNMNARIMNRPLVVEEKRLNFDEEKPDEADK